MHWLYSFLMAVVFVIYIPLYVYRTRVRRGEPLRLAERLGCRPPRPAPGARGPALWIHAVSVGEVLSLRTLVARLRAAHPDWIIYFSTLTNTGYDVARARMEGADRIFLMPLDFAWIVRRYFRKLRPDVFILAESEFWPNLLRIARRRCRAVLLINGRISPGSFKRHHRLRALSRGILMNIDRFLVQTETDRERLEAIGLPPGRVRVVGNLKAEIDLPAFGTWEIRELRQSLGVPDGRRIVVAGSTHRGEEEPLLAAFQKALARGADAVLLIAPRHPDRAEEVEKAARAMELRVSRRTAGNPPAAWQVMIIDTIGELAGLYAVADAAFVGGSLVPHGGQNLLEPAFYAKPVFFGPHMENFAALAEDFVRRGAARQVSGGDELEAIFMLTGGSELREMGQKAAAALAALRGATDLTCEEIERSMAGQGQRPPGAGAR